MQIPPEAVRAVEQNFSRQERQKIRTFYLQSGLNYEAMNLGDKLLMKVFRGMLKGRRPHTEEERSFLELMQKSFDHSEPENLEPMLNYIQGL